MTGDRAVLAEARTLAEIARRDPSPANLQAVRAALRVVARRDAAGISASGHGYNPYRDKGGRFAPGAHKARPTAGERQAAAVAKASERVGKAKGRVEQHAAKLAAAHEAKRGAIAETRAALDRAAAAAEIARSKPTAKNIKAAQVATNKATRAASKVGKHEAAIAKHTEAHAKATTAHAKAVEAHAKMVAGKGKSRDIGEGPAAAPDRTKADAYKASSDAHSASIAAVNAGTKAAHAAAAEAHGRAADAMSKIGNHDKVAEHQESARRHLDATGQSASADHARRMSAAAEEASARAEASGASGAHAEAVAAHRAAAQAHGSGPMADYHAQRVNEHERAASRAGARELDARAAHQQADPAKPNDAFSGRDAIRGRIAEGIHGTSQNAHIDPATQAALRDSNNRIMAAYGVTPRLANTPDAKTVRTMHAEEMGGAYGQMWSEHTPRPGLMTISHEQAALLREHMQLDSAGLHELARRAAAGHDDAYFMLFAAHTMHHETMHGHGPSIEMGLHRSTVEELTTEMSARRITADMHGVPSHGEAVNLAYDHIIDPVVAHTAAAAGVSRERAYEAMEHASLSLKRSSGTLTDDEAISHVATKAAEHLGQPAIAGKIANGIYQTSNKLRMGQ